MLVNLKSSDKFVYVNCLSLKDIFKKFKIDHRLDYLLKMDIEGSAIDILEFLMLNNNEGIKLPIQIALELEFPEKEFDSYNYRIQGILASLKRFYKIFYIPRMIRFNHYDLLLVRK